MALLLAHTAVTSALGSGTRGSGPAQAEVGEATYVHTYIHMSGTASEVTLDACNTGMKYIHTYCSVCTPNGWIGHMQHATAD